MGNGTVVLPDTEAALEGRVEVRLDGLHTSGHEGGEVLAVLERVVPAPCTGVFEPLPPETYTCEGEIVSVGQAVGVLRASGEEVQVLSPFTGFLMGILAHPGERVREGQPVAWLRAFDQ